MEVYNETILPGHKVYAQSNTRYLVGFTRTGYEVFYPQTKKIEKVCNDVINEKVLVKDVHLFNAANTQITEDLFRDLVESNTSCTCSQDNKRINILKEYIFGSGDSILPYTHYAPTNEIALQTAGGMSERYESPTYEIIEESIDYNWDDEDSEIVINSLKVTYDHFGEFDKNMFTAHQVLPLTHKQAINCPDTEKWRATIQQELDAMSRY